MTAPAAAIQASLRPGQHASLTPEQAAAVAADGALVVIEAGAGTGKTHTLAARAAHLARSGVPEPRILALTFTREATANLRRRIGLLLGTRDHGVRVLSFHQFAARELAPGARAFLDERDARRLMAQAARPVVSSGRGRALARLLGGTSEDDTRERLLGFVSYLKNRETTVHAAIQEQFPHLRPFHGELSAIVDRYLEATAGLMDFDDLLVTFRDNLREEAYRDAVAASVEHLLVDEYQDVNGIQHDIVRLLGNGPRAPRITVVGDDRQAIYGFRASEPGNLRALAESEGSQCVALTRNFRSGTAILDGANRLLPAEGRDLVPAEGARPAATPTVHGFTAPEAEARFVVERVERLLEAGTDPAEIAVLARSRHLAGPFQDEVAARVALERRVLKRPGVLGEASEWLVAWFAFVDPAYELTPETRATLGRLLSPLVPRADGVVRFVEEALAFKEARARGERPARPGPTEAWSAFVSLRNARTRLKAAFEAAEYAFERVLAEVADLPWRERGVAEAVDALVRRLRRKPRPKGTDEARHLLAEARAEVGESLLPSVPVLTIHAAKGLEWNHVFLIGAREGGIPSEQALNNERLLEEERRLLYVACTRPRRSLTISYATGEGRREQEACRWLEAFSRET